MLTNQYCALDFITEFFKNEMTMNDKKNKESLSHKDHIRNIKLFKIFKGHKATYFPLKILSHNVINAKLGIFLTYSIKDNINLNSFPNKLHVFFC